ncbi:hypothetical protein BN1708_002492, partial [Verticillium longisporum]
VPAVKDSLTGRGAIPFQVAAQASSARVSSTTNLSRQPISRSYSDQLPDRVHSFVQVIAFPKMSQLDRSRLIYQTEMYSWSDEIKTEKCDAKKDFSFAVCRRRTPKSLHALSDLRALTCRGMCLRVFVKHLYNHQAMRHGPVAVGEWRVSVAYIDCDAVALVVWQERAVARQPADLVLAEAPQQPPRHLGLCMYYSCGLGHEHSTCTLPKSLLCFKDWHELLPTPLLGSLEICTRP